MYGGTSLALAFVRVPRGTPRPSDDECWAALDRDRATLRLPASNTRGGLVITGPHPVTAGEQLLDEYLVWER
ncbi:MAG: hypothetical protein HY699_04205 [Deltaproteobacteria bacterium]|nr:hypothetical protein [Deltaproteobacteria bacterium]